MSAPNPLAPHEVAERALAAAGDGAAALVSVTSEADLRWANSMLTTNGERTSTTLTVVATAAVAGGTAMGQASGPVRSAADIDSLVLRARDTASNGTAAGDAEPLVSGVAAASDWREAAPTTSGDEFASLAPQLGEAFARGRADGVEHFGYAEHQVVTTLLATSTGLRLRHVQPTARLELTAKSESRTRSAWAGRAGRSMVGFSVPDLDDELRQGLAWQARSVEVAPGRHDTILSPSAVADMLVYLLWSSSARDAAEGRTVFSRPGGGTRLGETLSPAPLSLTSDPRDSELPSSPFVTSTWSSSVSSAFDLGLPLQPTSWITDGRLTSLVSTRHSASELGVAPTPMVDSLRLTHAEGRGTLDDLVRRTERGLLVTCLWYIREVDPRTLLLTGLTRDGVYLVEGGEVVGSVGNYRFNVSPVDMLAQVRDASETTPTLPREWGDYFTRAAAPAALIEGFNLSTRSDAL